MSEKVVLTQEQADAVELIKRSNTEDKRLIDSAITMRDSRVFTFTGALEPLNELLITDFAKALYIGYGVKSGFKIGDKIIEEVNGKEVVEITGVDGSGYHLDRCHGYKNKLTVESHFRHATPEEIERRWWNKHGREPWEIKEEDIFEYLGDLYIVDWFDSRDVNFKRGKERNDDYTDSYDYVKEHFKVVCFAEDRKDV